MGRKRRRRRERTEERVAEGPRGEGVEDQGDLLADAGDGPEARRRDDSPEPAEPPEPADPPTPAHGPPASDDPPVEEPPPDPASDRLAQARSLVEAGQTHRAIDAYRALVSDDPSGVRARNNLGVLYDELGQHAMALEQFEAARELAPDNVEVLTNLGASLGEVGRFEEAERELRRAQKLDPEALDVRANLGILYYRRGLYAQAEAELRWVCDHDHDHGPAHFYRGEALNRLGRVDQAMEVLERATLLQPGNAKAFYTLGILYDKKHMRDEAATMYRKARELSRS